MFNVYFQIGLKHIADLAAYDHILFIIALCAVYRLNQWKSILILVTAFTIGHSVTLALSALNIVTINSAVIEFLIPVTIVLTALYNAIFVTNDSTILKIPSDNSVILDDVNYITKTSDSLNTKFYNQVSFKYLIALFFGLIHGMGFSNYFKALLGQESNITLPLFAFNIGIEAGQLIIVAVMLVIAAIVMEVFKASQRAWNLFISGAAFGIAFIMMLETWPF